MKTCEVNLDITDLFTIAGDKIQEASVTLVLATIDNGVENRIKELNTTTFYRSGRDMYEGIIRGYTPFNRIDFPVDIPSKDTLIAYLITDDNTVADYRIEIEIKEDGFYHTF